MTDTEFTGMTAAEITQGVRQGRFSAEEVVAAHLNRIEKTEDSLHAFITVVSERALQEARQVDQQIGSGEEVGPLAGVPVAVKDNICTGGVRTTAASRMLADYEPPYDATVVRRLRDAGAIVIGKTNMDEFGMGSSTENSAFSTTRNPWNLERVPGGSSGGSAAAVAAGQAPLALGSDTGGSIRQPAAFCGVVGVKPTYGRVSRYGLVDLAPSLDQIGPMARTAHDAALLLSVIAGHDPADVTSSTMDVPDYVNALNGKIEGMRIGIPEEYLELVEPAVASLLQEAIKVLEGCGAKFDPVSLPHTRYVLPTYRVISAGEASSSLARYDGVRFGHRSSTSTLDVSDMISRSRGEGFGEEAKRRIIFGAFCLSSDHQDRYYRQAQRVRSLIKEDFDKALGSFDLLITPVTPSPAFPLHDKTGDALEMYRADVCTPALNLAGLPGVSVPCGFINGLPVGMQLVGRPFAEEMLLQVAAAYQDQVNFHRQLPPLPGPDKAQPEVTGDGR